MIPNILYQTWKTKVIPSELRSYRESWTKSNPNTKIILYSDDDCNKFIEKEFGPDIYFLYSSLPHPIMRADFWRVAMIYIHGGFYGDLDLACNVPLNTIVHDEVDAVFIKEINNISNFFFGAVPKHPAIKKALDYMIEESSNIIDKNTQSFGMHSLHRAVREYYQVIGIDYPNNDEVQILNNEQLKAENKLVHVMSSLTGSNNYQSWRDYDRALIEKRQKISDILFFTTFNENGYDLYGESWIKSWIKLANVFPSIKAKIYYEGKKPIKYTHPNLTILNFSKEIPEHKIWKEQFLKATTHAEDVKRMTIRFSFKSFVIQHALLNNSNQFIIWLDGDCIFKLSDYEGFPENVLNQKFLACQVEENWDLNHVESGILIFDGNHNDKNTFVDRFRKNYSIEELVPMGQPYDGFVIYRSLLMSKLDYVNLNAEYGKGGIQSDPNLTFLHPEIKNKFIHNIGWTGKNQYENWEDVFKRDEMLKFLKRFLFGNSPEILAERLKENKNKAQMLLAKKKNLLVK
jgi:mannosyltransferase OCH1-like enzyme